MSHPVPPPEPPSIIQIQPEAFHSDTLSSPTHASTSQSVTASPQTSSASPNSFAPELSQSSTATRAELLGTPISVGYPVKPVKTKNPAAEGSSRPIQPLKVSGVGTTNLAKLKKIIASETNNRQTKPPRLSSSLSDLLKSPAQPVEFNFQAPVVQTQPEIPTPAEEQREPLLEPPPASIPYRLPNTPQLPNQPAPAPVLPATPQPQSQPAEQSPVPSPPQVTERIVELTSDRQEYDQQRQIVTAEGKVVLRFGGTVLNADRLQVNLPNFTAVGEGNIALTSGQQLVRGERFTYNFVQERGEILNARGDIYLPTTGSDFSGTLPTDVTAGRVPLQPLQQVTSLGGFGFTVGSTRNVGNIPLPEEGGDIRRVRFEAERVDLNPEGWQARNVSLTNDPFSPPELEVRANTVTLTRETPLRTRIKTTRQRLVFNQGLSVPIPRDETVIDRNQRDVSPAIAQFGFDDGDRGGVFVERGFSPINTERVRLRLTPQFFLQKAVTESGGNVFDSELYGLRSRLNADLGQRTSLRGSAIFTSLNLNDVENNLRASLRLRQLIGNRLPHNLTLEYSYRDRLYNGTLGYQTVQSSIGGILTSPAIPLGNTGINLSYQAGAQYVSADTDRLELLDPFPRENNRASLSRFQGTAALSRGFLLWQGQPLPSTATEGLRYTPVPVVPYLILIAGVTGTSSFYSSGDTQTLLSGTIGLQGQLGHFSRPLWDYTSFNISYSQGIRSGLSPFLFDRAADTRVLGAGLTQQIYGPFRFGVQTYVNLDTREQISTDYILEYSRRTYGVTLRYNPALELGSLSLRISDFNWSGGSNPFSDSEIRPVLGGVRQEND